MEQSDTNSDTNYNVGIENSNWSLRRKMFIYTIIMIFIASLSVYGLNKYQSSQTVAQSCTDNVMNQHEGGIDCEGECVKVCREHMSDIKVLYAKAIPSIYGYYDLIAMIENNNIGKTPSSIPYIFRVYDGFGIEIASSTGVINITDGARMPLIVSNIKINNTPNDKESKSLHTTLELGHYDMYPSVPYVEKLKVHDYKFDKDSKTLIINISNDTLYKSNNAHVYAVISDMNGDIKAVGQTLLSSLNESEQKQVAITWSSSLADILDHNHTVQIYIASDTIR